MTEPLVQALGVSRRFGDFVAVDDVSIDVAPGEIVGLLGANGAGKTTLIRMILGLLPPSGGSLTLFGAPPSRESRERLGYVSQGLGLWEDLTVKENLGFIDGAFGSAPTPLPASLVASGDTLVGSVGLGAQRQLAFVGALSHRPELLVLDEPTSGVDPLARARLWDTIRDQADAGVGTLVTTHYMQEAQRCDRLVLMSRGVAVAQGTERDIVGDATATEVRAAHWKEAFAALDAANILVALAGTHVRAVDASEEDIRAALADAGVTADLVPRAANLDEAMVVRERQ